MSPSKGLVLFFVVEGKTLPDYATAQDEGFNTRSLKKQFENLITTFVPFPVRFDFSDDPERFIEVHHPYSHLTLGQFKNCRIPVCAPVSPFVFGGFILRNFYNTVFRKYSENIPVKCARKEKLSAVHSVVGEVDCAALVHPTGSTNS